MSIALLSAFQTSQSATASGLGRLGAGSAELPRLLRGVTVACIGPITRATAEGRGLATQIVPEDYTIPALARAIVTHFEPARS